MRLLGLALIVLMRLSFFSFLGVSSLVGGLLVEEFGHVVAVESGFISLLLGTVLQRGLLFSLVFLLRRLG